MCEAAIQKGSRTLRERRHARVHAPSAHPARIQPTLPQLQCSIQICCCTRLEQTTFLLEACTSIHARRAHHTPKFSNVTSDTATAMQANKYLHPTDDEVDARDIAALLAELKDVGGAVTGSSDAANARPYSEASVRRGVVGGTSGLKDPQRSAHAAPSLQHRVSAGEGGASSSTTPHHRLSVASRPGNRPSSTAAASRSLAPISFSTYSAADTGLTDAQLSSQRLFATPLGVRLKPLGDSNDAAAPAALPPLLSSSPRKAALPASPSRANAAADAGAPDPPLTSQSPLPPLPSLGARGLRAGGSSAKGVGENLGEGAPSSVLADVLPWPTSSDASAGGNENRLSKAVPAASADAAVATAVSSMPEAPREVNFLPIMCARYLRPVGLTPTARLGHTLTPVTPDTMLLFGGLDLHGEETTSLMAFSTTTISWEPLYTLSEAPVARHSHAACAYDGRYLVISGGVAQHGGAVLNDMHVYDLHTHHWRCVWDGQRDGLAENRNEPGPRFGHTMVLQDDRLYLYGGKTTSESRQRTRRGSGTGSAVAGTTAAATLANGSDVYVFSLSSYRWRRRVRAAKEHRPSPPGQAAAAPSTEKPGEDANAEGQQTVRTRPATRAYHAACIRGNTMYINGGSGASGVLTDTWSVQLHTGEWHCVHRGGTADAVPREKHAIFVCGEALLLVGGCSGGSLNERMAGKFTHFAVVLPLVGNAAGAPCWIPVAMGNMSIVQPHKKSFAAALTGGFVYVFGGVCGAEPATNSMVRFLAADGYVSENDQAAVATSGGDGGAQRLRLKLQQLREQQRGTPFDCYVYAGTYGSADVASAVAQLQAPWAAGVAREDGGLQQQQQQMKTGEEDVPIAGLHRAILHQRAPLLRKQLEGCRSELYSGGSSAALTTASAPGQQQQQNRTSSGRGRDEVDALLQQVSERQRGGGARAVDPSSVGKDSTAPTGASAGGAGGLPIYFTNGTPRVPGLAQPLTADALQCLVDYVYWGGLKAKYRVLLEEKDEDGGDGAEANSNRPAASASASSFTIEYRARLVRTLEIVKAAGEAYELAPLVALCASLLAGDREQVRLARQRSTEQLRSDMAALLSAPSIGANTTMLVVDPHTQAQSVHVLHACILLAASDLFTELLRPLYRAVSGGPASGGTLSNRVGPLAAKLSTAVAASPFALLTSSSKRTVLIGPVPLPLLAVQPILRYLYTQQLQAPSETAFEVMLGAHQLGLSELQALCEAAVAREVVNYQTCCSLYHLARKYQASLLEEIALLTAVSGFATVRNTSAYQLLSDEEKQNIDAVATELGSSTWVPPPQPMTEMKSRAIYNFRWDASAPSTL
ncbi:Galactose oxidase, central domain/Kelch motif containing protein, putative [Leishmania donovani]|uniref:Galactose oxidase, central domain/Kelch motif containing protein, putative n=1 Tax=Leishmania donovani TaxID=5661 RepID=A0A3S7WXC7_LEIDO|nr:Galactose oxidase, central domain/Kelch motif containing protein, putative [Leishmania donovani]